MALRMRDKWMSGFFLFGVTVALWGGPSTTYSWMWHEAKESGHQFVIGLLDISSSSFAGEWKVVQGGNQVIDLSKMIPGDARQLEARLSKGDSDLDFFYKIIAEIKDEKKEGSALKLSEVLRIRIECNKNVIYDGLLRDLTPLREGNKEKKNGTEELLTREDPDKDFLLTVYLPSEGVDASYQALSAQIELRFLAKQATPNAIYAE